MEMGYSLGSHIVAGLWLLSCMLVELFGGHASPLIILEREGKCWFFLPPPRLRPVMFCGPVSLELIIYTGLDLVHPRPAITYSACLHGSRYVIEAPLSKGLPTSPQYRPPIGRSALLRDALDRWAQVQRAQAQQTQTPQALVPCVPQVAPTICQPPPSWPATPYQQAVQPPSKSTGMGVTFDSSTDKSAPTGSQDTEGHGRQSTQGQDDNS